MSKYGVINYPNGNKYYEGFVRESDGSPWGAGCSFWPDGTKYQEGLFGLKGLLCGREYYPTGNIRFEGYYELNRGYGPNFPRYGTFFFEDGEELFYGVFKIRTSGLGWPFVEKPEEFGKVIQESAPKDPRYNRKHDNEKSMPKDLFGTDCSSCEKGDTDDPVGNGFYCNETCSFCRKNKQLK